MAVYKEITVQELENRQTLPVTPAERDQIRTIVTNFISHLKASVE